MNDVPENWADSSLPLEQPDDPVMEELDLEAEGEQQDEGIEFSLPPMETKPMLSTEEINAVFDGLKKSLFMCQASKENQSNARTELDRAIASYDEAKGIAMATDKIVGKNQEIRDAFAHQMFATELANIDALRSKEQDTAQLAAYADMIVNLWKVELERVKTLMQIRELQLQELTLAK